MEEGKGEKLKELWQDQKSRSAILLGFIVLFFIIVIIVFSPREQINLEQKVTPLEKYKDAVSYEFSYNNINGLCYDNKYLLYIPDKVYVKDNTAYRINTKEQISVDSKILRLTPKNIYNLISNITPTKNENYSDYLVSMYDFAVIYDPANADNDIPVDNTITNENSVLIRIYENTYINKVEINISNYTKITNDIITITYTNIDKLNDFTEDFDKMIGSA